MDLPEPLQKPDRLSTLAVMTLVSGILNLAWSALVFLGAAVFGIGTFAGHMPKPLRLTSRRAAIIHARHPSKNPTWRN